MFNHTILKTPTKPDVGLRGRYRFTVRDSRTGHVVRETDWMDNIIVDAGLDRLGAGTCITVCMIGTGTSTPVAGDTTLQAQSAFTTLSAPGWGTISNSGSPDYISSTTYVYRFNAGTLNGNYSEVGVGWSQPNVFSRALILDGGGSPTTISVGITEFLDVFYQIQVVPNLADVTSSVVISGTTHTTVRRPAQASSTSTWRFNNGEIIPWTIPGGAIMSGHTGALGAVTGLPTGTGTYMYTGSGNSRSTLAYSGGSYERVGTGTAGLDGMNLAGGIAVLVTGSSMGIYQISVSPNILKDATKVMTLTSKCTWARL